MSDCSCEICLLEKQSSKSSSGLFTKEKEPEIVKYRTQKAKGLCVLKAFFPGRCTEFKVIAVEKANITDLVGKFVRPCPVTPRHGFVDSRKISTKAEAISIISETLQADENAELILMSYIDAPYSGVWTPGRLVLGPGTDGATSGKGSRTIEVLGYPFYPVDWDNVLKTAGITDSPYMEILFTSYDEFLFVQLRDGPKLPESVDFIPSDVEVKQVVKAEGDLLAWEEKVKIFEPGTVVYHPGGSLASHYSVHAVLSKVPVLISKEPKVGDVLKANTETHDPDIKKIKAGFVAGCNADIKYDQAAYMMLTGCHSVSVWLGRKDFLLGYAIGCMYRLIITASLGEARHRPGAKRKSYRDTVYQSVWPRILSPQVRAKYLKCLQAFETLSWPSGFGGHKWFEFAKYAGKLMDALLDEDATKVLMIFNEAVNAVHNGGWAFNKFISDDQLTIAAYQPAAVAVKCGKLLYNNILLEENNNLKELADWFKKRKKFKLEEELEEITKAPPACDCKDCSCVLCFPNGCEGCDKCEEVESDECNCGEHDCGTCYPDGCECNCSNCHDNGCASCCDCGSHDCNDCYPDGCSCECTDCHDNGDECDTCKPPEEEPEPEEEVNATP